MYLWVEFAGICLKRCLIKMSHVLGTSCDHVYPVRRAFSSGIANHRRECRLPCLTRSAHVMDELLRTSGVENEFVMRSLEHWITTLSESKVEQIELSGEGQSGVIGLEDLVGGKQ